MQSITTSTYQVHFNTEAAKSIIAHLRQHPYSSVFILVDENTARDCLPIFIERAGLDSGDYEVLEIRSGEVHKNLDTCVGLWQALSDRGADRKSLLINLGGGVLTDLGGFVASAFKRGISFVNVPTSLLAMVDASIGGKTGVDLGPLKNQIGVINQPEMVLIMTDFLHTLDARQRQSGFAEMLKHGLINSRPYWDTLKNIGTLETIDRYIFDSVQIKNQVVLQDPEEKDLRKVLNYGHTLGHAIESYFLGNPERPDLLHGEAIAIGMVLEAYLSFRLCGLDEGTLADIRNTFQRYFPKVSIPAEEEKQILSLLQFDKKNSHGRINFVLLKEIGEPVIDVQVPAEIFADAFRYYRE